MGSAFVICPSCVADVQKKISDKEKNLSDSYGKVSEKEYRRLLREFTTECNTSTHYKSQLQHTTSSGVSNNILDITIKGVCIDCGFNYHLNLKNIDLLNLQNTKVLKDSVSGIIVEWGTNGLQASE